MRLLRNLIDVRVTELSASQLFKAPPEIHFDVKRGRCLCGGVLTVKKTRKKTVYSMEAGALAARETVVCCQICHKLYFSEELARVVPHRCRFSYNVIEHVGRALFLRGCSGNCQDSCRL